MGTHGLGGDLQEDKIPLVLTTIWPDMWTRMSHAAKEESKTKMDRRETQTR